MIRCGDLRKWLEKMPAMPPSEFITKITNSKSKSAVHWANAYSLLRYKRNRNDCRASRSMMRKAATAGTILAAFLLIGCSRFRQPEPVLWLDDVAYTEDGNAFESAFPLDTMCHGLKIVLSCRRVCATSPPPMRCSPYRIER